jgi:hypothetical protein
MKGMRTGLSVLAVRRVVRLVEELRRVVLAAVIDAENRDSRSGHAKRDHRALAVMRQAQARQQILAWHAAFGKGPQVLAEGDDRVDVTGRREWRASLGNVGFERVELVARLRREDDPVAAASEFGI